MVNQVVSFILYIYVVAMLCDGGIKVSFYEVHKPGFVFFIIITISYYY